MLSEIDALSIKYLYNPTFTASHSWNNSKVFDMLASHYHLHRDICNVLMEDDKTEKLGQTEVIHMTQNHPRLWWLQNI